ncbi:MAG: 6-phosphogluconolactonase [Chloroflexaceae bacterium]|jgi:6-phosphogluconolactonase|nr:6-phosphogluconolactonase [Chloroflexaceae bacterium]
MEHKPDIRIFPDAAALQAAAAERIASLAASCQAEGGAMSLVLAGGNTPRGLYQLLAQEPWRSQIDWSRMHLVWGDERYVPHNHPDSNYLLAKEALLNHVQVPSSHIYPMPTHAADPARAAQQYETAVHAVLALRGGMFDLVLLGMGPDGHTASLFPHHPALHPPVDSLVLAVDNAPKPPPQRLTLTATALNRARLVLVLATGADKNATLRAVVQGPYQPEVYPVQLVRPPQGHLAWMLDAAAGEGL